MTDIPLIVDGDAYWMVDQRCGSSGGHLIPLCLVPMRDAEP